MPKHLKSLENVLGLFLQEITENTAITPNNKTTDYSTAIAAAVAEIKDLLLPALIPASKHASMTRHYQLGIIAMLNQVWKVQKSSLVPGENLRGRFLPNLLLIESVSEQLDQLLGHLRRYFPAEFDMETEVPIQLRQEWELKAVLMVRECNRYGLQYGIDSSLLHLLLWPFSTLIRTRKINYIKEAYLHLYEQQLAWRLQHREEEAIPAIYLPIQLNLNTPEAIAYYQSYFTEGQKAFTDDFSKTAYLQLQLKMMSQVHVLCKQPYLANELSLQEQVCNWLTEELYFYEKKQQAFTAVPIQNNGTEKFTVSMPVTYLSVGVRLLIDAGLISKQNASETMRLVSKSICTEKVAQISENSLRNKAYNVDPSVIEGMKGIMANMMNLLRGY